MGQKFCEKVNEYLTSTGEEAQRIGVIHCNPDQSKHLETARMRIFDVWVDFVNLRSEDYCENSRIPTMRFDTAEEDAYRRDLTINSLFYNINTSSVEDFTGRGVYEYVPGLADLTSGKIVTPLPPEETFLDDPLRVLRAIRFAARFEFTLDDELKRAARDEDVKSSIAGKISRERIGHEASDEQKRLALYATLFLPLKDTKYRDNKAKEVPAVDYIFRSSLKLKASDAETVIKIHNTTKNFISRIAEILSGKEELETADAKQVNEVPGIPFASSLRVQTGLILREIKEFWRVALLASILLYPSEIKLTESSCEQLEMKSRIETFKMIERKILDLGLEKVWEIKPLVNGKEIMNVLQLEPGPHINQWQQELIAWQLAHPSCTSEECLDWMRQTHSERARPDQAKFKPKKRNKSNPVFNTT